MNDHLLDELFVRFDPEGRGKVRDCALLTCRTLAVYCTEHQSELLIVPLATIQLPHCTMECASTAMVC